MAGILIIALVVLWFFGYIQVPGFAIGDYVLFVFNGHRVTVLELLIFLLMLWAIEQLGSPLRQIAVLLIILWLLSTLGIIAIAGLSNIIVIAVVIGLVLSLINHRS